MNVAANPVVSYLHSSVAELRKVTWPTRREAVTHAALVIGITAAVAAIFAGVDALLSFGLSALLNLVQ